MCKETLVSNDTAFYRMAALGGSVVKNLPAMQGTQETWVRVLGQEDPLEKEMANHSSILAWRSPWRKEPGGLQSAESQRVGTTEQQQRYETIIVAPFAISDGPSAPLSSLSPQRDHSGRTLNVPQLHSPFSLRM